MKGVSAATVGMFDGVHRGHRHLIAQLKDICDSPVVVTFSNHPLSVIDSDRSPRLLTTPLEKASLLEALGVRPVMLEFDEELRRLTAEQFVNILARDYGISRLMLGFNNSIGSDRCSTDADLRRVASLTGVDIVHAAELPDRQGVNSSAIRSLIAEGNIAGGNTLLGHHYTLSGTVVHGKALGRQLGFPTANIMVDNTDKLIPADGVYAADAVTRDGRTYRAVVNIGHRPTVDSSDSQRSIEAHLIGCDDNLYGEPLTLKFIEYLRAEQRFTTLDDLRAAIAADIHRAQSLPG